VEKETILFFEFSLKNQLISVKTKALSSLQLSLCPRVNDCVEQSSSWEANGYSASKESSRLLWNPKFHYSYVLRTLAVEGEQFLEFGRNKMGRKSCTGIHRASISVLKVSSVPKHHAVLGMWGKCNISHILLCTVCRSVRFTFRSLYPVGQNFLCPFVRRRLDRRS